MLLIYVTGNEDIVQINEDIGNIAKNAIHQPLECLGNILKPKGHAEELPEFEGSDDGRLGDVCQYDRNLVVATNQIYFGKYLFSCQAAVEVVNLGQGVPIIHSSIVEALEVATGSPATTSLRDNVKW